MYNACLTCASVAMHKYFYSVIIHDLRCKNSIYMYMLFFKTLYFPEGWIVVAICQDLLMSDLVSTASQK